MSISTKDYTPAEATKRFGILCRDNTQWWYGYGTKNIKTEEVIEIFTSGGSLKLPFRCITNVCLYTSALGDPGGFLAFAVEKNFKDVLFEQICTTDILVDLSKVTKIRHYENVFFTGARKQEVESTLMKHTQFPTSLIDLINTWLPSSQQKEVEETYDEYGTTPKEIPEELLVTFVSPDGLGEADIDNRTH